MKATDKVGGSLLLGVMLPASLNLSSNQRYQYGEDYQNVDAL